MIGGSRDPRDAFRLPWALLAYASALALFLLVPPLLGDEVGPTPGFTVQEALDLLTPVVVVPLMWLVIDLTGGMGRRITMLFLAVAAIWVEGQAIHLAANAIDDAARSSADFYATVPGELSHWLDEVLSHWIWHVSWAVLSLFVVVAGSRPAAATGRRTSILAAVGGLVHGVVLFVVTVEGSTAAIGIVLCALLLLWTAGEARRGPPGRPVVSFYLVASMVTLAGYAVWAAYNGGSLPELSTTGLFA